MELETTMNVGSLLLWSLGGLGLSLAGGVGVVLGWAAWWVVLGGILGSRFLVLGPFILYVVVWRIQGAPPPLKMDVSFLILNAFTDGFLVFFFHRIQNIERDLHFLVHHDA